MELLDYVHLKHPIILNTNQHNKLKDFIKFKYRIEVLINFDMIEFDIGYFNAKEQQFYVRNVFNITLFEK